MAIPNNPLVAKATLVFKRDLRTFVNTFHFSNTSVWTEGDMLTLANKLANWWQTYYRTSQCDDISLQQIQIRKLDPDDPLAVDYTSGLPLSGTSTSPPEAANVTQTLSWRTGLAGRKYRGRCYIPSVPEDQVGVDDRTSSTFNTTLATVASKFLLDVPFSGVNPVIFHLATNTFTKVVSFVIENILDSQRRRLPARGR